MTREMLAGFSRRDKLKSPAAIVGGALKGFALSIPGFRIGFDIDARAGIADSGDDEYDLTSLFAEVECAARDAGIGVAYLIDEMQFLSTDAIEAIVAAIHRTTQHELPVALVGAGLPQLPLLVTNAKRLRRAFV